MRLFELWWRSMKDHFGSPDEFVRAWFMSNGFPEGSIFRRYLMGFFQNVTRSAYHNSTETIYREWHQDLFFPKLTSWNNTVDSGGMRATFAGVLTVDINGALCPGPRFPSLPPVSEMRRALEDDKES